MLVDSDEGWLHGQELVHDAAPSLRRLAEFIFRATPRTIVRLIPQPQPYCIHLLGARDRTSAHSRQRVRFQDTWTTAHKNAGKWRKCAFRPCESSCNLPIEPLCGDHVRSTTRYIAVLGAVLAALAVACAEPTAPHSNSLCSGGGSQGWDHCGTDSTTSATTTKVALP